MANEEEQQEQSSEEEEEQSSEEQSSEAEQEEEDDEDDGGCDKQDILEALKGCDAPGEFAAGGPWNGCPMFGPGLEVEGVGVVGLPLSNSVIKDLIKVATKAPYGKGSKTLVDEAVRKSWQIDANKVRFSNPQWQWASAALVRQVAGLLGTDPQRTGANLYKLLLYEKGGHFKPHKDTEKEPGMFGTLVVQLPTAFEGGTIRAQHGTQPAKTYAFGGPGSGYGAFFAAFYSDVEHAVTPISAGHRLALVFNLVHLGGGNPPFFALDAPPPVLVRHLRNWTKDPDAPDYLVHVCEHEYTQCSLDFDQLKNKDKEVARILRRAAREAGVVVCLGMVEHKDTVDADNEGEVLDEEGTTVTNVVDARGQELDDIDVDLDKHFLADDPKEEGLLGEPDEDHSGYTGNEGATIERTYQRCVFIMWPASIHLHKLIRAHPSIYGVAALAGGLVQRTCGRRRLPRRQLPIARHPRPAAHERPELDLRFPRPL